MRLPDDIQNFEVRTAEKRRLMQEIERAFGRPRLSSKIVDFERLKHDLHITECVEPTVLDLRSVPEPGNIVTTTINGESVWLLSASLALQNHLAALAAEAGLFTNSQSLPQIATPNF